VTASVGVADHVLHLPEVRAFARMANAGSRRVLEKAGFEFVRFVPEMDRLLYRWRREGPPTVGSDTGVVGYGRELRMLKRARVANALTRILLGDGRGEDPHRWSGVAVLSKEWTLCSGNRPTF
jgi:hypothetical protein